MFLTVPQQLNADLQSGKINYDQYQQGMQQYNAVSPSAPSAPSTNTNSNTAMSPQDVQASITAIQNNTTLSDQQKQVALASLPKLAPTTTTLPDGTISLRNPALAPQAAVPTSATPPSAASSNPNLTTGASANAAEDPYAGVSGLSDRLRAMSMMKGGAGGPSKADKWYQDQLHSNLSALNDLRDSVLGPAEKSAQAFADQSSALADEMQSSRLAYQAQQQDDVMRMQALAKETSDQKTKTESRIAELESQGIDPMGFYHKIGTGGTIAAAIAMGLGAFAAHPLGPHGVASENTAGQIIQGAIRDDIDAQKTNLAKNLSLMKERMNIDEDSNKFKMDMLKSERDSHLSAYSAALNDLDKRAALFKDNADVQDAATKLRALLGSQLMQETGNINLQLYKLQKAQEGAAGAGRANAANQAAALQKQIQDRASKIYEVNKGSISPQEALRQAQTMVLGHDYGKGPMQTANNLSSTQTTAVNAADDALSDLDQMIALRRKHNGGTFDPEETAKGKSLSIHARGLIGHSLGARMNPHELETLTQGVPEDPLEHNASGLLGFDPTLAKLIQTREAVQRQRDIAMQHPSKGEDDNPMGFATQEE